MGDCLSLFAVYRVVVVRGDEVVQGVLRPELGPEHPTVRAALDGWEGTHFLHHTAAGTELTLVRSLRGPRRERWWLHVLLAVITLVTTTLAGSYLSGREPLQWALVALGPGRLPVPVGLRLAEVVPGLLFSVPLFAILLGHELGHYIVARRHGMDVSPPFFIPAPHWLNLIGTFGAFIRLRSAVVNRVVLMDVGAAGPLVSFALSLPLVAVGGALSGRLTLPGEAAPAPYVVLFGGQPIWLGGAPVFDLLTAWGSAGEGVLRLHPLAFAGWIGLFVTALNLFPLAQLDGGHILYALLGPRQRWVGLAFLGVLLGLGTLWWGWWLWAGLILLLGRGRVRHPSVLDPSFPLPRSRRLIGWFCVLVFLLTFVIAPIQV